MTAAQNIPSTTIAYDLTGLTAGAAYDVQLLAVNSVGGSPAASLSFVMGQAGGLAETGTDVWLYAGVAIIVIAGAAGLLWRTSKRPNRRATR